MDRFGREPRLRASIRLKRRTRTRRSGEWLPTYRYIDDTASVRQLLNHTSGIHSLDENPSFERVFGDPHRWTDEEILLYNFQEEPYSAPGDEWHYSSTGYLLLGLIIEEATGSSVSAVLRDRFFEPLGMSTAFYFPEETAPGEVVEGWFHPEPDPGPRETFSAYPWTATLAVAGGIFASADDLATWTQALFHDQTVLSAESLDQMLDWTPLEVRDGADYGLGVARILPEYVEGAHAVGHGGNALFYSAVALYLPDYGVAIGVTHNSDF